MTELPQEEYEASHSVGNGQTEANFWQFAEYSVDPVVDLKYLVEEETKDPSLKLGMKMLYRWGRGLTNEWADPGHTKMETSRHNSVLR